MKKLTAWKIKQYHEAPIAAFKEVQKLTDGDYALVHLFETNDEYFQMFKTAVDDGRDVLLDNSLYELRNAFNGQRYVEWINKLQPTWFIVPDSWKNGAETARMFFDFLNRYGDKVQCDSKIIGVAQGNTISEVAQCYHDIEKYCDKIAFNLDFATASGLPKSGIPYCLRMSVGRVRVLQSLYDLGVINEEKPHHLLGCGVPQEAMWYNPEWTWVDSIDTCNPVLHGIQGVAYNKTLPGLLSKEEFVRMCDIIDSDVSPEQMALIKENILEMTEYCKKNYIN